MNLVPGHRERTGYRLADEAGVGVRLPGRFASSRYYGRARLAGLLCVVSG